MYEKEYIELVKDFNNELREKEKQVYKGELNFALLGSPLMKSDVLILGINWGGSIEQTSDESMPLVNELLAWPKEKNNKTLLCFFTKIFGNKYDVIQFLNKSIYTNACFIRTPNTECDNSKIVKFGFDLSLPYLSQMIDIIEPKTIICFGNGENSTPTLSISKLLGLGDKWWTKIPKEQIEIIDEKATCYYFCGTINKQKVKVYSFPHSRNINCWGENAWQSLDNSKIFLKLKIELK
ncbi:MAG: hypothetical protein PHN88_04635 [Ignavibacteria bacterium]|nr:hypothetical protein [Ignavibacteria bacterium]